MGLRLASYAKVPLVSAFAVCLIALLLASNSASAAVVLVQTENNIATSNSVSASFSSAATAGNLLVVICGADDATAISTPSGFSTAINESDSLPAQAIFYKVAAGGETSVACNIAASVTVGIHIYEYSGVHTYQTFELANASPSTGSGGTPSSGSLTTVHQDDLLIAAITTDDEDTLAGWGDSFTGRNSFGLTSGKKTDRAYFAGADRIVGTAGSYSSSVNQVFSNWRGQIAAFRVISNNPSLTADIVDNSGNPVISPSVLMSATSSGFTCQTSSGTLVASPNRIRVSNTTDSPDWTLAIAATGGTSSTWTSGSHDYDFNDPAGSGCSGGQLTVESSGANLSAQANCPTSGVTLGSNASFSQGSIDSIAIASASPPAYVDCYWDISDIALIQKVPAGQNGGSYSLDLTLTVTAN